jgi:hypothetical protein
VHGQPVSQSASILVMDARIRYLQHGLLDAIGLDEPVARKVLDKALIRGSMAAPGHTERSRLGKV